METKSLTEQIIEEYKEYICKRCGKVFKSEWSDEEADKEALELHGKTSKDDGMVVVCDDCFNDFRNAGLF